MSHDMFTGQHKPQKPSLKLSSQKSQDCMKLKTLFLLPDFTMTMLRTERKKEICSYLETCIWQKKYFPTH